MTQNPACNKETSSSSPPLLPQALPSHLFSALAAKYVLQNDIDLDDDCFEGNQGNESDTDTFENDGNSGDSENEVYT